MDWLIENKDWIFSGIGVTILAFVASLFLKNKNKKILKQSSGNKSINIQSGNDINIGK
ncbi:MAG: hypothetical protein WC665_10795 [Sulfurimonas sp.]|jgi:hypothetical protein